MQIVLTGATGFVASHLIPKLLAAGHEIRTLGRRPVSNLAFTKWDTSEEPAADIFESADAVIHLAGETVAQRWTDDARERIRSSRIDSTRHLVAALSKVANRPKALLCASAVGFYGSRSDEILTENSLRGSGFLPDLTDQWEKASRGAEQLGIRVVNLRSGIILGADGGAFPKMVQPFRLGAGGRLGSGKQWMSWIHIDDAASLIVFALGNADLHGAVNVTSPQPVTNADFTHTLGHVLGRPTVMAVPQFALRFALGAMAEMVFASERVVPAAAEAAGFHFTFPELDPALRNLTHQG
jgi:uncharacterized protein (TIGR01777 family)